MRSARMAIFAYLLLASAAFSSAAHAFQGQPCTPTLKSVTVAPGKPPSMFIQGNNFGTDQDASQLLIDGKPTKVGSWSDQVIVATLGDAVKSGKVSVKMCDKSSNEMSFKIAASPAAPACKGQKIPLFALSGTDADQLAQTLTSLFRESYVVSSVAAPKGGAGGAAGAASAQKAAGSQPAGLKGSLCVTTTSGTKPSLSPGEPFSKVEAAFDQENFSGGNLTSQVVCKKFRSN
jgi:hypothetical protein